MRGRAFLLCFFVFFKGGVFVGAAENFLDFASDFLDFVSKFPDFASKLLDFASKFLDFAQPTFVDRGIINLR